MGWYLFAVYVLGQLLGRVWGHWDIVNNLLLLSVVAFIAGYRLGQSIYEEKH